MDAGDIAKAQNKQNGGSQSDIDGNKTQNILHIYRIKRKQ